MKSYYIYTYGCQMNTADSERLSHQLETVGYIPTDDVESADLILLNTCAVRETAETKVFGRIGELKRLKQKNKNSDFSLHSVQSYSLALAFLQDEKSIHPKTKSSLLLKRGIYTHLHQRYSEAETFPDQNIHFHKFDLQKANHISPAKAKAQPFLP